MKFLANVFTTESFDDNLFYNIVDDEEKLIEGIPTLIIGKANAKRICPCGFRFFGANWEQKVLRPKSRMRDPLDVQAQHCQQEPSSLD